MRCDLLGEWLRRPGFWWVGKIVTLLGLIGVAAVGAIKDERGCHSRFGALQGL